MAGEPSNQSSSTQRGIAQSERLVLLLFGGLTAFTGFVVLMLSLPPIFRVGVGVPVTAVGAALCALAVRSPEAVERDDITPDALLAIERLSMAPLALSSSIGAVAVLFLGGLHWWIRLPAFFGTAVLALTFWWLIIRNRLPERMDPSRRPVPDRALQHTED